MIRVQRLSEPDILIQKKMQWLTIYLRKRDQNPRLRPPSSQYGHQQIRQILATMSFHKCYYCENKIAYNDGQVDHREEVAKHPELAFEWRNLYWSCRDCNQRLREVTIHVHDCLDPCSFVDDPTEHLTYEDEVIRARRNSSKGLKTIQKYRLDRENLDYLRAKSLQQFERLLRVIREKQLAEQRRSLSEREGEVLNSFRQPDHAFSLMFDVYLTEAGL